MSRTAQSIPPSYADISQTATFDIPTLLTTFHSFEHGLTETEARKRLNTFGFNTVTTKRSEPAWLKLLKNLLNPLLLILVIVAIISFAMGNMIEGVVVLVMVAMSVILNFFQEHKASHAAEALQEKVAHTVAVLRNSKLIELPVSRLVPGDIIELNAGDLIPADARLIQAKDLFVNQSALTGESYPVEKNAAILTKPPEDALSFSNIVFCGTSVITGCATAVVVATGARSQFGSIATALTEAPANDEFSSSLQRFSTMMMRLITFMVVLIFLVRALLSNDFWSSLQFAVAVAVGLTPEFLPMIMSVTMSQGSVQMAKKGVIVKKLTAIPTLGSMNILCTDKTGTLTENKISVVKFVDLLGNVSLKTLHYAYINSQFQSGITNPMDDAVRAYGDKIPHTFEKVDEIPFDFERKKLSVVVADKSHSLLITKGAPEAIMASVSSYFHDDRVQSFTKKQQSEYLSLYETLSQEGFRVLGVAMKTVDANQTVFSKEDEHQLTFCGFIAFLDPAKKGARKALDEIEELGIEVKVITGDNELVAQKICQDVDIPNTGILLGSEIDQMTDAALAQRAISTTIFARFDPEQKNRVINVLRSTGNVIGYMGDGINDAPSLMSADVGISVANAVEVAREAADFVLTTKSLHELAAGVREGRKTFGNTMKYVMMGLSSNFGNMFSMLGAVIFLPFLPMLPAQILLNNFIYDFTQVAIPTDHVDEEYIQQPKRLELPEIKRFMVTFGPISSLFDFITFGVLYYFFADSAAQFQTGWFMLSLATQTSVIHIIRTRLIPFVQSKAAWPLLVTTVAGISIGWILPYTLFGPLFHFDPLPLPAILSIVGIAVLYLLVVETVKRWFYTRMLVSPSSTKADFVFQ